jgi:hypothetical protein
MMGLGPYRPLKDVERALERGDLKMAVAAAKDCTHEHGRPIHIELSLRFLPLVASQQNESYDRWAYRWLMRWLEETSGATIDQVADVAGALAELPNEPQSLDAIREMLR